MAISFVLLSSSLSRFPYLTNLKIRRSFESRRLARPLYFWTFGHVINIPISCDGDISLL
jgi:hypothetical protein